MNTPLPSKEQSSEGLVRGIGVRALAANIVNQIIGSGIFVLPAAVAAILGPASVLAYIACATGIGLLALCFAELGSRVARSGGTYAYVEAAFGPFPGYLAGLLVWLGGDVISSAAISVVIVESCIAALGLGADVVIRAMLLGAVLAALALANVRGVRTGATLVEAATAAKLLPLLLLVALGLYGGSLGHLMWTSTPTVPEIGRAALILAFAFTGTEGALTASGEVTTPARTIPRAIFLGLAVVTTLYLAVQLAAQGILGEELARQTETPLAAAAGVVWGSTGRSILLAGTLISAFGYLTGNMLAAPRMLFAFARDGVLPRLFGAVHPRHRTPHIAIGTHAVLAYGFALTGTFRSLAVLSVVSTLLVFLACCLALVVLRRKDHRGADAPFRAPGGLLVPGLTAVFVLWLLSSASWEEGLAVGAMLLAAAALYWLRGRLAAASMK